VKVNLMTMERNKVAVAVVHVAAERSSLE
jgi:hypothetical protein